MREKKLKVGDKILLIAFKTLEAKGDIDVTRITDWGCFIKDNTTGIESSVSKTELKEWNKPKTIEVVNEINGVETIEINNLYYPTKWVRKRVC